MAYGTLQTLDTLASTFQTVAEFGENNAYDQLQAMLTAHNAEVDQMMLDLVDRTTDMQRVYGTTDTMTPVKTDEYGRPDSQKAAPGAVVGFPLDSYQIDIQWTRKYLQTASVAEVTGQAVAAMDGDALGVVNEIKRAFYMPTNYTFNDYLTNRKSVVPLQVRRLVNADGLGLPAGPNGETFNGSTHTHYLGTSSLVTADVVGLLETVLEHFATGQAEIAIARSEEVAIRAMTPNFIAFNYPGVTGATTAAQIPGQSLNAVAIYNRMIGWFNGVEVWIRPWCISGLLTAYMKGHNKPLALRTRNASSGGLVIAADDEKYPLRAKNWEREYGVGVWNRIAMAVLDSAHSTYTAPTIAG